MDKRKLLVLYGGVSAEHDVSIKSARELSDNLDAKKYDPFYVFIDRDGFWWLVNSIESRENGIPVVPSTDRKNRGLVVLKNGRHETLPVDVAFPMLHGKYGEDGIVQGVLEMAGIPYVGCGIAASALCIDKALTYTVAQAAGVRVPRHIVLMRDDEVAIGDLCYPVFVKPARTGSSFGVNRVQDSAALDAAVREARQFDSKILIEEAIVGREIGCAVMGNGHNLAVGAFDQIDLSGGFFRIHQEENPEQGSENATFLVPAPISETVRTRVVQTGMDIYRALGCRGLARVDMFLTPDDQVVLNEINTMPGFTSYSRYPRMMTAAGVTLPEVVNRLINLALESVGDTI